MTSNIFSTLLVLTLIPVGIGYASVVVDTTSSANFTINESTPGDQITILNGPIVNGFQTTAISSSLNNSTFEVANKTNVTVNDLGGGDTITLNISTPAVGLTGLIVNGGNGADAFSVTPSATVLFTINGEGNPQPAPGNVLTVILAGTTGAILTDTNTALGFQGAWTFTGSQPVNFTGIETLIPSQVTPEPAVLPLVSVGCFGLFIARIRRNRINARLTPRSAKSIQFPA
jgi:hypothetical protein